MTRTRSSLLPSTLSLTLMGALLAAACGGGDPEPDTSSTAGEVAYEPAFPEDVSAESLSDEDVAQQETHSHGGEEHSHGEGGHDHGEGEDHEHDEGEDHEHDGDQH